MSSAWSQARIKMHKQGQMVLVLEITGNDVHVFRDDQEAHFGHVLQLCRNAAVRSALDS